MINVNNKMSEEELNEIITACNANIVDRKFDSKLPSTLKVFNKYFNPQNPKYNINSPLPGQNGWTPLIFATFFGKEEQVQQLLNLGADPSKDSNKKITVLHISSAEGNKDLVNIFLNYYNNDEAKERNNFLNAQTISGKTALMGACQGQHVSTVQTISDFNPNIQLKDKDGKTWEDHANGNQSILSIFLKNQLDKLLSSKTNIMSGMKRKI